MLYIWKVITGKVPNFRLSWDSNSRRGRMIVIRSYKATTPSQAKNLIDQSLGVHGGRLFNLLPSYIRNFEGSTDEFKTQLDEFLTNVPDMPLCDGLYPVPVCKNTCRNSNSLIDWIPYLNLRERRQNVDPV